MGVNNLVADEFYQKIGLVESVVPLRKKLDKKMFYENAELNRKEKNVMIKYVERIELTYLLNPSTINIQPFIDDDHHFGAVMFITVTLRNNPSESHISGLRNIIHGSIPNPVIITFVLDQKLSVSTCMKRLNKVNKNNVVLGTIHQTTWFEPKGDEKIVREFLQTIHISNLRFSNFYDFYFDIYLAVKTFQDAEFVGKFKLIKNEKDRKKQDNLIRKIKKIKTEIIKIQNKVKKETQFNKKVELNIEMQQLKQRLAELKEQL